MWDTNGRKIKHFLKALNLHRKKSGNKNEKAIDSYIDVLKKEEKEWTTAWVKNAKAKAAAKLKKYGIWKEKVQEVLERRGLSHLSSKIS
jgi:hypothetical protein